MIELTLLFRQTFPSNLYDLSSQFEPIAVFELLGLDSCLTFLAAWNSLR